jgi:hypothetical protein
MSSVPPESRVGPRGMSREGRDTIEPCDTYVYQAQMREWCAGSEYCCSMDNTTTPDDADSGNVAVKTRQRRVFRGRRASLRWRVAYPSRSAASIDSLHQLTRAHYGVGRMHQDAWSFYLRRCYRGMRALIQVRQPRFASTTSFHCVAPRMGICADRSVHRVRCVRYIRLVLSAHDLYVWSETGHA